MNGAPPLAPSFFDSDGDGVEDSVDDCPDVPNGGWVCIDGDEFGKIVFGGSAGEPSYVDLDACPGGSGLAISRQFDSDGDGTGDWCDEDDDGDGIPDSEDPSFSPPISPGFSYQANLTIGEIQQQAQVCTVPALSRPGIAVLVAALVFTPLAGWSIRRSRSKARIGLLLVAGVLVLAALATGWGATSGSSDLSACIALVP